MTDAKLTQTFLATLYFLKSVSLATTEDSFRQENQELLCTLIVLKSLKSTVLPNTPSYVSIILDTQALLYRAARGRAP